MENSLKTIVAALGLTVGILSTYGDTHYWDNNGGTAGFGTAGGTWGTDPNWSADSTGTSVPTVTHATAADDLYFGTASDGLAAGTITVEGTNQAFRSMTFGAASGAVTLLGGTLTLAAPASEIRAENASNTIASVLAGTNGLHQVGLSPYPSFLTTNSVTVFANAALSDYVNVTATMDGNAVPETTATPYYFTNSGETATVQFQVVDGTYIKCVKVELTQSGTNIAGRAVYAKYTSSSQIGFDFDTGGSVMSVATAADAYGYGITQLSLISTRVLTLSGVNTYSGDTAIGNSILEVGGGGQLGSGSYAGAILNSGRLLYNSSADQSLSGAISGTGALILENPPKSASSITYTNFLKTTSTVILSNAWLSDCVGADGVMGGAAISTTGPYPADAYHFTNNGTTATYQLQALAGTLIKCVKVELTQSGADIAARGVYAKYISGTNAGFDFDTSTSNVLTVATSYGGNHYGAAESTFNFYRHSRLTLSGTNSYVGGTVVNHGVLEATRTSYALPSAGGITVNNGGELVLNVASMSSGNADGVGNGNPITVNSGGTLTLAGQHNSGHKRPLTIDGGTLNCLAYDTNGDCANYINNLTLKNGARVTGNKMRVGALGAYTPMIVVSGTNASSIEAGLNMVKVAGTTQSIIFNVADVTGNPEADLSIPGGIKDFSIVHTNFPIIKTGAGTLSLSGVSTHIGPITLSAGTLALRADNTLNTGNAITLNGGSLDMGSFSNGVGTLIVATNSVIVLSTGKLAFADSSALAWTNALTLTGTLGPQTLRFGTNANALTGKQISAITLDGGSVRIKSDGYLAPGLKGTLMRIQ